MELAFHKMHGLGNDFMLLDCRRDPFSLATEQIRSLGNRRTGVGFDQLLVIETSALKGVDARYRIFNQDGTAAEHCGNGVRCVAKFLHERLTGNPRTIIVEINGQKFELSILGNGEVRVDMGAPVFEPAAIPATFKHRADKYILGLGTEDIEFGAVSMGNPHAVLMVKDIQQAPVEEVGTALQFCDNFPNQVNVGFMQVVARDSIRLRVWERGAGETQACGTGACAAVVIGRIWNELDEEVTVGLTGGNLQIEWNGIETDSVWMTGPASYVFEGRMTI